MAPPRSAATFPTGGDYVDALQHPRLAFTDPDLAGGTVQPDELGMPQPVSGNFASVFQVHGPRGARWAVKCFVRPDPDRHTRYGAIAAALDALEHAAFVDFDYQREGVMISGVRYPLLKMRWIDAHSLVPWLEANLSHPHRLLTVADQFADIVTALERAGIAHGDLQHGNLLVTAAGELKLIDYDGMYLPQIAHLPANEKGLVNYQHPLRSDRDYGPGLDRFSAWTIYTSLVALAARPDLWRRLRASNDDTKLLFSAADYLDPAASTAFRELRVAGPHLAILADRLAAFTQMAPSRVPALQATPAAVTATAPATQSATADAAPEWLTDHLPAQPAVAPTTAVAGTSDLPSVTSFTGPRLNLARIAGLLIVLAAAGGAATVAGTVVVAGMPVAVWIVLAVIGAAVLTGTYRTHPLTVARRHAAAAHAQAKKQLAAATTALKHIQRDIAQLDTDRRREHQLIATERDTAARQRDAAIARVQGELRQALQATQQQRIDPRNTPQAWQQQRLAELAVQHVHHALATAVIARNPPRLIDTKIATALAVHGFRTAADFVGFHTASDGRNERTYLKRTPTDYGTYVENVGEKRAGSLLQWREMIKTRAEQQAPTTLTAQQHQELATQIGRFRAELDRQDTLAKSQARTATAAAKTAEQNTQMSLDQRHHNIETDYDARNANLERRRRGADADVAQAHRHADRLHGELVPLANATMPTYLLAAAGFRHHIKSTPTG